MNQLPASQPQDLELARARTEAVQHQLEVASAELGLANDALDRHLPPGTRHGDVAWAMAQNAEVERKVQQAAEELEQVAEMLEQTRQ